MDLATLPPVLISGYYGLGNLGDEAVLAGLLAALRARAPGARFVVLSGDPESTRVLHHVEAWPRSPMEAWRALGQAQALISGGGSLVQDATSARSAMYYLGVMGAAARRRVPVIVVGQGVGPIRRGWVRKLAAWGFNQAAFISVRDEASARLLQGIGVRQSVSKGADLAFLAPASSSERAEALLTRAGLGASASRIGVAIRPWSNLVEPGVMGKALRRFAQGKAQIAVLVFARWRDRAVSEGLARASGGVVVALDSPHDLMAITGAMDLIVAVRLHGLIFAAAQGVPAVGFAYDPKIRAFAAEHGLTTILPINARDTDLIRVLEGAWDTRTRRATELQHAAARLRASAAASIDAILPWIAPGRTARGAGTLQEFPGTGRK